jgi:hypothetical protein
MHAAECRELLQCLVIRDPACRMAMEWLNSLVVVAVDGEIAPLALQLAGQLQGAVGSALANAADPGPEVVGVLQREPQAELQAVLEVLEPITSVGTNRTSTGTCSAHP